VTGGHDMSLMEVNEASLLIQEAAHEDANIIFGAVVDPNLDGRVKVTVIATGFDSVADRQPLVQPSHTPVDLQHYAVHLKEKPEGPVPTPVPAMDLGRLSIARRPALDLAAAATAPAATMADGSPDRHGADLDLEAVSAFDVPAFLRREG
jgi:cell division protein FtsZ